MVKWWDYRRWHYILRRCRYSLREEDQQSDGCGIGRMLKWFNILLWKVHGNAADVYTRYTLHIRIRDFKWQKKNDFIYDIKNNRKYARKWKWFLLPAPPPPPPKIFCVHCMCASILQVFTVFTAVTARKSPAMIVVLHFFFFFFSQF